MPDADPIGHGAGHWRESPLAWPDPETAAVARETRDHLARALGSLPTRQRVVVTLRDVQGYTTEEVCQILEVTPTNERVLLHRAQTTLRAHLAEYVTGADEIEAARLAICSRRSIPAAQHRSAEPEDCSLFTHV